MPFDVYLHLYVSLNEYINKDMVWNSLYHQYCATKRQCHLKPLTPQRNFVKVAVKELSFKHSIIVTALWKKNSFFEFLTSKYTYWIFQPSVAPPFNRWIPWTWLNRDFKSNNIKQKLIVSFLYLILHDYRIHRNAIF